MAMQVSLARALHAKERAATYQARDLNGNPVSMPAYGADFKTMTTFESALRWKNKDIRSGEKWTEQLEALTEFVIVRIKTGKVNFRLVKQADNTFAFDRFATFN